MKIQELIGKLLAGATRLGTCTLPELVRSVQSGNTNGIAVSVSGDREFYLAILDGEPEGAILIEEKGTLYGDKAVMMLAGTETFDLYDVKRDYVEAVVVGCRVLEKGHIRRGMGIIPEVGRKSDGLGLLSVAVRRNGEPQNGVQVAIRKDMVMMCNDVTTQDGTVRFRLLHGKYDCIVHDRTRKMSTFPIIFDPDHTRVSLEI